MRIHLAQFDAGTANLANLFIAVDPPYLWATPSIGQEVGWVATTPVRFGFLGASSTNKGLGLFVQLAVETQKQ